MVLLLWVAILWVKKNARIYMPLIGSLALVIFVSNMIGVIPGFEAPTSNINFTASLAIIVLYITTI